VLGRLSGVLRTLCAGGSADFCTTAAPPDATGAVATTTTGAPNSATTKTFWQSHSQGGGRARAVVGRLAPRCGPRSGAAWVLGGLSGVLIPLFDGGGADVCTSAPPLEAIVAVATAAAGADVTATTKTPWQSSCEGERTR